MILPFMIRGSDEWEKQEWLRRGLGCKCLSFGVITRAINNGLDAIARPIQWCRRIPDDERLRVLEQRQVERKAELIGRNARKAG